MRTSSLSRWLVPVIAATLVVVVGCNDDTKSSGNNGGNNATNNGTNNATNNGTNNATNNGTNNNPNNGTNNNPNNGTNNANNGACVEDDNSPNHAWDEASAVELGFEYDPLQICPDASDWFKVELAAGARAEVLILFSNDEGDLDLYAYGPNAVDIEAPIASSESTDDFETMVIEATEAGTYYIEVSGFDGAAAAYSLTLLQQCTFDADCGAGEACLLSNGGGPGVCGEFAASTCGQDEAGEPNDTDSRATAITLTDNAYSGTGLSICEEDADLYLLELTEAGSLSVELNYTAEADLDVYVIHYDTGATVAAGINEIFDGEMAEAPYLAPGRYIVRAQYWESTSASVTYSLDITFDPTGCPDTAACADAAGRPFCLDSGACGTIEGNGAVALGGECDSSDDCTADASGCFTDSVTAEGFLCTLVCAEDADCATVGGGAYCSESQGACLKPCGGDNACPADDLCDDAGRCVSRECIFDADCTRAADSCLPATFDVPGSCGPFVAAACGQGDAGEPNDTDSRATAITLTDGMFTMEGLSICDSDVDVYAITTTETGTIAARVDYPAGADLDIYIIPEGGDRALGLGLSTEDDNEVGAAELVGAGTYFIRVVAYPGDVETSTTYSLTVSFTAGTCAADADCLDTNVLRLTCTEGACVDFAGAGAVAVGGNCDTSDDCVEDAALCYNAEGAATAGTNICTITCDTDAECAAITDATCEDAGLFAFCLPPGN